MLIISLLICLFSDAKADDLKKKLSPLQYKVTKENGTEMPFQNEYWDHKEEGIYVDVISGKALFSSTHKYDSKTGWPSFDRTIDEESIIEKADTSLFTARTEVRSKNSDSHLGHVFDDGPPTTGKRFCINSASLRFIPRVQMVALGYSQYLYLFEKK